jgi:hypothetical protein
MLTQLKRRALKFGFNRYYAWRLREFYEHQVIEVDYPVDPSPRYVPVTHAHPMLWLWFDRRRASCRETLATIARYRTRFEAIAGDTTEPRSPQWNQKWFSALDAMALYALIASRRPKRIVEIGSGNSTKFAAAAIRDEGLATSFTSIDPQPREEIDALCDEVLRAPLERVDQRVFERLQAGDLLFVDSSHRAFTNSDVTTFFLEILPGLPRGVLLHLHDIFLPWDYPAAWRGRFYSEQYLLSSWMLAAPDRLNLVLSNVFVSYDPPLRAIVDDMFSGSPVAAMLARDATYGGLRGACGTSFWAEVSAAGC